MHQGFRSAMCGAAVAMAAASAAAQTGRTVSLATPLRAGQTATFEMHHPAAAAGRWSCYILTGYTPLVQPIQIPGYSVTGSLRVNPLTVLDTYWTLLDSSGVTSVSVPIPNVPTAVGFRLDAQTLDGDFVAGDLTWADNDVEAFVLPPTDVVDLVILAGQSNADGRELLTSLPPSTAAFYTGGPSNLRIYYKPAQRVGNALTTGSFQDDGAWWQLDDVHSAAAAKTHQVIGFAGSSVAAQSAFRYGPELAFGQQYYERYGATVELRLLKAAVGGASIRDDWDVENAGPDSLWTFFKDYVYDPAVADILADGKTVGRVFFVWMQGQADAASADRANDYQHQLGLLYDRVDSELTAAAGVTIVDIGIPDVTSNTANGATVEAAKATVAAGRSNVYYFPADGSGGYPAYDVRSGDPLHFSGDGYDQMMSDLIGWFVANDLPFLLTAPVVTEAGGTLTATSGVWRNGSLFSYQWLLDGVAIPGATAATHVATTLGGYSCVVTPFEPGAYPAASNTVQAGT